MAHGNSFRCQISLSPTSPPISANADRPRDGTHLAGLKRPNGNARSLETSRLRALLAIVVTACSQSALWRSARTCDCERPWSGLHMWRLELVDTGVIHDFATAQLPGLLHDPGQGPFLPIGLSLHFRQHIDGKIKALFFLFGTGLHVLSSSLSCLSRQRAPDTFVVV